MPNVASTGRPQPPWDSLALALQPRGEGLQGMLDALALSTTAMPGVGDVAGLAADGYRFATDPSSRTWGNAGWASLGLIPFVPAMGAMTRQMAPKFVVPDKIKEVLDRAKDYGRAVRERAVIENKSRPSFLKTHEPVNISTGYYTSDTNQSDLHALADWIASQTRGSGDPSIFWRGTDRPGEYKDIKSGKQIISRNHVDNRPEAGLSVASEPHYVAMQYKHGYQVTGDLVGIGSDGEPLLSNVRPVGPLMSSEKVAAAAKNDLRARLDAREALSNELGLTGDEVSDLLTNWQSRPSLQGYQRRVDEYRQAGKAK